MKGLKTICKAIDTAMDWVGKICSFAVLGVLAVILIEVILRRIFNNPQIWTMDAICMTFGCYIILICAYGFQKKAFVSVDVLFGRLSPVKQRVVHLITYLIFFVPFVFVLLPKSWSFFYKAFITGEKGYSVWAPVVWPVKLCLFIGLVMLGIQGISEMLKQVDWLADYFRNGKQIPEEASQSREV